MHASHDSDGIGRDLRSIWAYDFTGSLGAAVQAYGCSATELTLSATTADGLQYLTELALHPIAVTSVTAGSADSCGRSPM